MVQKHYFLVDGLRYPCLSCRETASIDIEVHRRGLDTDIDFDLFVIQDTSLACFQFSPSSFRRCCFRAANI